MEQKIAFFLLFGFLFNVCNSQSSCDTYIANLIGPKGTPNISPQTFMNSGKGLNDLGSYIICNSEKDYRYLRMIAGSVIGTFNVGLCIPNYCTEEEMQKYDQATVDALNSLLSPDQTQIVQTVSYEDPNNVYPSWTTGTYIVAVITSLILACNVIGTGIAKFIYYKRQAFEENQKQTLQQQLIAKNNVKSAFEQSNSLDSGNTVIYVINFQEQQVIQAQSISYTHLSDQVLNKIVKPYPEPMWFRYVKCFSFFDNMESLFRTTQKTEESQTFDFFNGMRALSIFWVIYGHAYMIRFVLLSNTADASSIIEKPGFVTLAPSAYFAVDVFFFMGGFLAAVLVIEKLVKMKKITATLIPSMWVHRFLRLWPTYAFILVFYWQLSPHFFSGPLWGNYVASTQLCNGQFWKNLLFIDNFFQHGGNGLEYCFGWGWYMANDFQIFMITPFLLILYVKNTKAGLAVLFALLFGSLGLAYGLSWKNNYHVNMPSVKPANPQPHYQDDFYYKPYIRISPYIMGILFGLIYREWKVMKNQKLDQIALKIQTSVLVRVIMYSVGIGLTQMIIWMIVPLQKDMNAWPHQLQYFYQAFNRVIFILGVAICITPALLGIKNDPTKVLLGHPIWVPIARISFCMYLMQLAVIMFTTYGSTQINYFQTSHFLFLTIVDIFFTMVTAGLLSLLVEVPFMNLEKLIFGGGTRRKSFVKPEPLPQDQQEVQKKPDQLEI